MIYLIHGQNIVDSRRFLIRLKSNYENIETISGKTMGEGDIRKTIHQISHSIFGGKSAILIEHFNGKWQAFPKKFPKDVDIILWSGEKIKIGDLPVKNFLFDRIEKATVFKAVDAVLYRNEKHSMLLIMQLLNSKEPAERLIGALARSFYFAYCAKEDTLRDAKLAPFVRKKIEEQARLWSRPALKKALIYLLWADVALKEGLKDNLVFSSFVSRVSTL